MGKYIQKFTGLFLAVFLLTISSVIAQAPLGFNYQGVALTNAGTPVSNKVISLRIALIESQQLGATRFQETHNVNTDAYGQFSVIIGNGQATTGKISDVQWSKFPYYMKVELDLTGGTAYVFVGTSQLLSVPYALYANNAGAASISVDSVKNELATIRLIQKGDSIVLNNNRGGVFIPKIDSLIKVTSQLASIKAGVLKNIKDSITKLPNGIAIGYNALNNFDSIAFNSSNIALGQNAGVGLTEKTSGISNADNILIGQNAAASINASGTNTGAYQNIMIGNGAGQNTNLLASQNIVIGHEAAKNSSGTLGTKTSVFNNNIAIGARTLKSAIASESNVSIGVDNMNSSTAASRNVTIGYAAAKGVTGDDNVIIGNETVTDTSSNSAQNVIIGSNAAQKFMGNQSVIIGFQAGQNAYLKNPAATGGVVAIGSQAGLNNLIGLGTFVGQNAGRENTTGFDNTFIGARSGWSNTTGAYNTYLGFSAGHFGRSGSHNTFIGRSAGYGNIRGEYNTLIGAFSADIPTDTIKIQSNNVVLGSWAARKMNGSSNVILGDHSAQYAKVGNQNIIIGGVMQNETDSIGDNKLYIGNSNTRTPLIYGEFDNKKITINGDLTVTGKTTFSGTSVSDSTIKLLNKRIDSLVTALSIRTYGKIDSSSLFIANPIIVTKFLDSTMLPAILFDGSKTYVNIGSANLASTLANSNLTFEFWVKNTLKNTSSQTIFSTGYDMQGQGINISLNAGRLTFSFNNFNHQIGIDYPNDSLWHHVAYTNKDRSTSTIYLDGIEKMRSNNVGLNISSSQRLAIGATIMSTTPQDFYKGSLRKMRINKGINYLSNFTPSYTYSKSDSTVAFWELNELGTRIKATDSAYNGTLYNGTWLVPDTSIKINNGLVGYYPFNGNANDSSLNGNNGIVNGATLTTDRYGKTNSAYLFKDNFINIPNHKSYEFNNYTISFWAATTSSSSKQIAIVKNNYNDATSEQFGFAFNDSSPNGILFGVKYNNINCTPGVGWQKNEYIKNLSDGNFHHYVGSVDGDIINLYIDGLLVKSIIAPSKSSSSCFLGDIQIGRNWKSFNDYFQGKIDDIRIYNRVLNIAEISYLSKN